MGDIEYFYDLVGIFYGINDTIISDSHSVEFGSDKLMASEGARIRFKREKLW
jgi:hypothetical protein